MIDDRVVVLPETAVAPAGYFVAKGHEVERRDRVFPTVVFVLDLGGEPNFDFSVLGPFGDLSASLGKSPMCSH
jgi:hypothetical protein